MTLRQERVQEILDALGREPGVRGALLVTRDGLCALNRSRGLPQADTFSAMCAALVGAAEAALAEWNESAPARVTVETPGMGLVLVGIDAEVVLVAATERGAQHDKLRPHVDAAAARLAEAIRG